MGFCWNDYASNQRLLRETESWPITSIVRKRQLRLYGHEAHYPEADPGHWVVSEKDNPEQRKPRGRPQSSWLGQGMISAGSYLVWERGLYGDSCGMIAGVGIEGLMRWCTTRHMPPMIDGYLFTKNSKISVTKYVKF